METILAGAAQNAAPQKIIQLNKMSRQNLMILKSRFSIF